MSPMRYFIDAAIITDNIVVPLNIHHDHGYPDSHLYRHDIGCISAISGLSLLCRADIGAMLAILAVRTMQPTSGQYRSDVGDTGSI